MGAGGTTSGGTEAGGTEAGGTEAGGTEAGGTEAGGTEAGGSAGTAGTAGTPPDLSIVRPTVGCGTAAPGDLVAQQLVQRTIETSGHKENSRAPAACLPDGQATYDWNVTREYFVRLPTGYDPEKAYPLVLQAGCARGGSDVLPLSDIAEQVIQVVFKPAPRPAGCPWCFDVPWDGNQSGEFPFYEAVWQRLQGELCFDQNRVFAAGIEDAASMWANELGCVYAGHAKYPMRAIGAGALGLPDVDARPTCSESPMAGMWLYHRDQSQYWDSMRWGIEAAMPGNGCPGLLNREASWLDYEVPGLDSPAEAECQRIAFTCAQYINGTCLNPVSCSASSPMVRCAHGNIDDAPTPDRYDVANVAFAHFFRSFFAP